MSEPGEVVRIAAKGDGVTADGRFVPGGVPGDVVGPDGAIVRGPHHIDSPCQHFGRCGGCKLQHLDDVALAEFVRSRVVNAAEGQGVTIEEILPTHLSPPRSRRRATLHAMRTQKGAVLGFREGGSHQIVDLKQCEVLRPELFALVVPACEFIAKYGGRGAIDVSFSLCDQGVDCSISNLELKGLAGAEAPLEFARHHGLARLSIDQGYGAETVWEPEPATVTLSGTPVVLPPGAFLQATLDAEATILADVQVWLEGVGLTADLFSGLGTFAFGLVGPRKVLAVEADRAAYLACKSAAAMARKEVHALHRDLFRNPLDASELNRFAAVVLDPPRAGAREQVARITESELSKVAYISCNPSSWARDAAKLVEAGFKLKKLRPVGQFRWSTHVELTSLFER